MSVSGILPDLMTKASVAMLFRDNGDPEAVGHDCFQKSIIIASWTGAPQYIPTAILQERRQITSFYCCFLMLLLGVDCCSAAHWRSVLTDLPVAFLESKYQHTTIACLSLRCIAAHYFFHSTWVWMITSSAGTMHDSVCLARVGITTYWI